MPADLKKAFPVLLLLCHTFLVTAQADRCYATLSGDTLRIGNKRIERTFRWNGGVLRTLSLTDVATGRILATAGQPQDFAVGSAGAREGRLEQIRIPGNSLHPACLLVRVECMLGEVAVRREYRLYEDVPAIACDMYLRGTLNGSLATGSENIAAHKNIESVQDMASRATAEIILDQLFLPGRHWHCKEVSFKDITDWGNYYPYRTLRNRCLSYDSPSSDRIRSAFA